ncbi:MAG: hypothetical protein AAGD22_13275 [Verrucomicrobiota bacterium]
MFLVDGRVDAELGLITSEYRAPTGFTKSARIQVAGASEGDGTAVQFSLVFRDPADVMTFDSFDAMIQAIEGIGTDCLFIYTRGADRDTSLTAVQVETLREVSRLNGSRFVATGLADGVHRGSLIDELLAYGQVVYVSGYDFESDSVSEIEILRGAHVTTATAEFLGRRMKEFVEKDSSVEGFLLGMNWEGEGRMDLVSGTGKTIFFVKDGYIGPSGDRVSIAVVKAAFGETEED